MRRSIEGETVVDQGVLEVVACDMDTAPIGVFEVFSAAHLPGRVAEARLEYDYEGRVPEGIDPTEIGLRADL